MQAYVYTGSLNNSVIGHIEPEFVGISQDLYGYAVDINTEKIFLVHILPNGTVMLRTLGGVSIPEQALRIRGSVVF